jgi:hypothetical protein
MGDADFGGYGKYVVHGPKPNQPTPETPPGSVTDMVYLDGEVIPGAWNVICAWFWPREEPLAVIPEQHFHDEHEVVAFFGSDPEDPFDLCGEVEWYMEGKKLIFQRSCLVYVPAGMRHGPLILNRIDRPVFHFSSVTESGWIRK